MCRYYPAAITVFSELTAQIELAFILAYPTPQAAAGIFVWSAGGLDDTIQGDMFKHHNFLMVIFLDKIVEHTFYFVHIAIN